ncbi:MAG: hypothetical protein FGF50_11745, partial [Candidatus Brockarchaeota archaeon]|nr:hypothetical protein [Candidatus Brockarchaeota archaeon]
MSPSYVVPEHFEEYTLRVPEHFEKRRVFVPGYEGYTHVKIYHPYSAYEIPGSFTISFQGIILEAEGVKVYTSFLPIADEGFELRVIPKEVTLNIYGDVLVGPLIPVQGLQTTVPVKFMVKSVEPAFDEKLVRENEARSILNVTGCGEIVAPEGYEVTLASKRVVRKPLWVDLTTYRRLEGEGFGRIREGCYWYEDGGREEWPSSDAVCDSTPLERELFANSIVLVYHPLQETPLESSLVRGIWLRNYATQDISYTVTVQPVTFPPSESESTTFHANKASCEELSVLLFSNTTFWVRLHKDGRLVAELFLPRVIILPFPFSLQWWRGFTLGLVERSPRTMVNTMMLSTVAMLPRELMPAIAAALVFLKAGQVYNQRGEIFNATMALGNLTAMGLIYRGMADGYRLQGKHGFAAVCDNLSQTFLSKAKDVASDLGLRLVLDVSLEDFKTALGWRKASEFEQGYAAGKIAGAMFEAITYAATFAIVYHEFSTARDTLTMAGEAGQLSTPSVLKRFAQGLYAWVTPAIWDLAENAIKFEAWLKGKLTLPDVSKLILADQVSKSFGETVGKAFETLPDGGEPEDIVKSVSSIVDKVTADEDIPEEVGRKMLDILGRADEERIVRNEWEKVKQDAEVITDFWKRVKELEAWEKRDEPGRLLIEWLESLGKGRSDEAFDALQKSMGLGDEELNSIGKALENVGVENGLKLFDTYFNKVDAYYDEKLKEPIREYFLKTIKEAEDNAPNVLDAWLFVIPKQGVVMIKKENVNPYLPQPITRGFGLEHGDIVTGVFDNGKIEVTGVAYIHEGQSYVSFRPGTLDILNVKEGDPVCIIPHKKTLSIVLGSNHFTVSSEKYLADVVITKALGGELKAYKAKMEIAGGVKEGFAIIIDVQKLEDPATTIYKTIRLWGPDIHIKVSDIQGNYYVRIEPLTLDDIAKVATNIKDLNGKTIVTYENGKLEFLGKWGLKDFEYEPNKNELKSVLAISDANKRISVDAYYDPQMGMTGKLAVCEGAYWRNVKTFWVDDAHKVITLKYGKNSHLVLGYEGDSLMPKRVGVPSAWGEVYYRITAEHLSLVL